MYVRGQNNPTYRKSILEICSNSSAHDITNYSVQVFGKDGEKNNNDYKRRRYILS